MKKKMFRKYSSTALSLLMAVSMVLGSAPVQAFAEGTQVESGSTAGASLDGVSVASSGNADQEGSEGGILDGENVASSGNSDQGGSTGGGSTGGGSTKPETETVTLTYDANAGDDEVTGLPDPVTVEKGTKILIADYEDMKREGYKILGWHTNSESKLAANEQFTKYSEYVLEDTLTLYAIWNKVETEKPEVPEGAKFQEVLLSVGFPDLAEDRPEIHFEYSYEYQGKTYEGTTENDKFGGGAGIQVLNVLVDEDGSTSTDVTLAAIDHEMEKKECWMLEYNDPIHGWVKKNDLTFTYSARAALLPGGPGTGTSVKFYYRDKVEPEKPETEIPEGAKAQEVALNAIVPGFVDTEPNIYFDYSYEYQGKPYEGSTKDTGALKVYVAEDGSTSTEVTLTANGYNAEDSECYALEYLNPGTDQVIRDDDFIFTYPVNAATKKIKVEFLYTTNQKITKRDLDIYVSFTINEDGGYLNGTGEPIPFGNFPDYYELTYSYKTFDEHGQPETETVTLTPDTAEHMPTNGDTSYWRWTIPVDVPGKGVYLSLMQNIQGITMPDDGNWVLDKTIGENGKEIELIDGEYLTLYVSADNNPVTPYLYNCYIKQYEVTYTDGVENEDVFADQTYNVKKGESTPAFDGTPARSGYEFIGWSPAVADSVTEDVVYTAQWKAVEVAEQFTVTYTDGVDNEVIFADQTYNVKKGESTPAFDGTPARSGYEFTGWSPAVADSVTVDVVYTAQWKKVEDGGNEQPERPDSNDDDDDDDNSYVEVPEEDVPLAEQPVTEILDENVPLAGQPGVNILDEDVPLANVPKTGDSGKWGFMTALSSLGLIVLFFTGRKKKEVL